MNNMWAISSSGSLLTSAGICLHEQCANPCLASSEEQGAEVRDQSSELSANIERRTSNIQLRTQGQAAGFQVLRNDILTPSFQLQSSNHFGAGEAASFWKRGSFRSGSNIGSSRSSAGVSGTLLASKPS